MITLKRMTWSNAFSYGASNTIDFSTNKLTQLIGSNGNGKTSIALILEEVLYNKNTKGIKKTNILNRYCKEKEYSIELEFSKGAHEYIINTVRGSTQKVTLLENGNDISAHTATATYKMIEEIIGLEHKTFAQIVYQSSSTSLEFLRSPDTARKKFLIELLNLGRYTKIGEYFKKEVSLLGRDLDVATGKQETVQQWITKYAKSDLVLKQRVAVPKVDELSISEAAELRTTIRNIEAINKRIIQNNTYKNMRNSIVLPISVPSSETDSSVDVVAKANSDKTVSDATLFISKMRRLDAVCPTCTQDIDADKIAALVAEHTHLVTTHTSLSKELGKKILEAGVSKREAAAAKEAQEDWEKYHLLIDDSMEAETLDKETLVSSLEILETSIAAISASITAANTANETVEGHNNKVALLETQLEEMRTDLVGLDVAVSDINDKLSLLAILSKTFSTTGLVAYKIEALVVDLQELSNNYLTDLSAGRFQISFQVSGADKLNVIITDNGNDIDIQALSAGEMARVNVAVLLAIRKLMSSLYEESRLNLLFLDETVSSLDAEGKERLIEILLEETELNTFLVSHDFTHPLLEKVSVVKHNNISEIEL